MDALPGIKDMRDALMHFDEWSLEKGHGPQAKRRKVGDAVRDIARDHWRFGYDPNAGTVSFGPYTIEIDVAECATGELCHAIYMAAREADKKNTAELRARTIKALVNAGIRCNTSYTALKVSPGHDLQIWLSLNIDPDAEDDKCEELATRIVASLSLAGLRLACPAEPQSEDVAKRLMRGESLHVEPITKSDSVESDEAK